MGLTLKSLKMLTIPAIPIETNSKTEGVAELPKLERFHVC